MGSDRTLKKRAQYFNVYKSGKFWVNNYIVVKALPNELEVSRCGFSVTKALGNAVVRNKIRRKLKEIVRIEPIKPGWDIVFIARRSIVAADYHQVKCSIENLLVRAHLLRDKNERVSIGAN